MELEEALKRVAELETQVKSKSKEFSEKENKLSDEITELKARVEKERNEAKEKEIKSFCEEQAQAGKLDKADFPFVSETLNNLDNTKIKEFSDSDGKTVNTTDYEQYKKVIEGRPAKDFSEIVTDKPKEKYDYSGENDDGTKLFSEVEKTARERKIPLTDKNKIAELTKELIGGES